jgi:cyanate permease
MQQTSRFFGWSVAWAAFVLALFAWGIGFYGPSVFLQVLHDQHGWSISAISSAITLHFLCSAAIIFYLPEIHRHFGVFRTTVLGVWLTVVGIVAWANTSSLWQLFPSAMISGMGWAVTSGAAINALVSPWFDRERPKAISLAFNGASVGGMLFAPLWMYLISGLGFQIAAASVGVIAIAILMPLSYRYFRFAPSDLGLHPDGAIEAITKSSLKAALSKRVLLADIRFITISAPFALALFAQIGLFAHLIARLVPVTGQSLAAIAVTVTTICAVVGRTVLSQFMGERDRRVLAAVNFTVQAVGVLLLALADHTAPLLVGCVLFGLGVGNLTSLPPLIAQKTFASHDVATVVALLTSVNQAVFALAPAAIGLLRDATTSYVLPFVIAAVLQVIAAVIIVFGRRHI